MHCVICYEEIPEETDIENGEDVNHHDDDDDDTIDFSCEHNVFFHKECIIDWIYQDERCPICRADICYNGLIIPPETVVHRNNRRGRIRHNRRRDECADYCPLSVALALLLDISSMMIIGCLNYVHMQALICSILCVFSTTCHNISNVNKCLFMIWFSSTMFLHISLLQLIAVCFITIETNDFCANSAVLFYLNLFALFCIIVFSFNGVQMRDS